jgi:cytochrome c biogenesis protein CcdA
VITELTQEVANAGAAAPLFGFLVGLALSFSPLALPSVPVVLATVAPGRLAADGVRERVPVLGAMGSVFAFVVGMDGVVGLAGYVFVEVAINLVRAAVVLHLVAAIVLAVLGLRLLSRRTSLCHRATGLPANPVKAFAAGVAFSVGGCPACGTIAIGVGAAAAFAGGPIAALLALYAFVLARTLALLAIAAIGSRVVPTGRDVPWHRLDTIVGGLFLAAAAYYAWRVASGNVTSAIPGEPGSGVLP